MQGGLTRPTRTLTRLIRIARIGIPLVVSLKRMQSGLTQEIIPRHYPWTRMLLIALVSIPLVAAL